MSRRLVAACLFTLCSLTFALAADPGPTIAGRVLAPGGAPLAKAEVLLLPFADPVGSARRILAGETPAQRALARTLTDARGAFLLEDVAPGQYVVRVGAEGYVPLVSAAISVVEDTDLPDAELPADAGLPVVVTAGGKPLAGALVQAGAAATGPPRFFAPDWSPAGQHVLTAPDGTARLARSAKDALDVTVAAAGLAPAERRGVRSSKLAFALEAGVAVPVDVRRADGSPAAGALLRDARSSMPLGVADAQGRVDLRLARGRTARVEALAADGASAEAEVTAPAAPPAKAAAARRIDLPALVTVSGRVIDAATRAPLPGALVTARAASVVADGAGAFAIAVPSRGRPGLGAHARGHMPGHVETVPGVAPTIALKPAATLEGRVTDRAGRPVAGAEVALAPTEAGGRGGMVVRRLTVGGGPSGRSRATSREDGRFRLTGVDPEPTYDLRARARGFAPATREVPALDPGRPLGGFDVELDAGTAVKGIVVDAGGTPVAGAEVVLRAADTGQGPVRIGGPPVPPAGSAASDRDGAFRVAELAPGLYDVTASRAGFAATTLPRVEVRDGGSDLGRIVLEPGVSFDGLVLDGTGKPVEGAGVTIVGGEDPMRAMAARMFGGGEPDVLTGPDGRFVVRDRRRGERVEIAVRREGYVDGGAPGIVVPPDAPLTVRLTAASRVTGRVLDPENRPVAGATVRLTRERRAGGGGMMFSFSMATSEETDAAGRFEITNVAPGGVALAVQAEGFQQADVPGLDVVAGKDLTDLEVQLQPSAYLDGRVLMPDGSPAIAARVSPVGDDPMGRFLRGGSAATDGDGRFRLDGLKPGAVSVEANVDGLPRAVRDLELRAGANAADFQLAGGQEVSGRVVDEAGVPVARASVSLRPGGRFWGGVTAVSGDDGTFTFRNVTDGEYQAAAARTGYAVPDPKIVTVAGAPLPGVELRLAKGAAVTGTIRGIAGADLARVTVSARRDGPMGWSDSAPDAQGRYRIENLSPGHWIVTADDRNGATATAEVTLEAGQAEATVDLDFGRGLTLTGRVLFGREPLADAYLFAGGMALRTTRTDADGRFTLRGLEQGRLEVTVNDFGRGLRHVETFDVEGNRDVVIRVPTLRVAGRVLDAGDRSGVAGVQVSLEPAAAAGEAGLWRFPVTSDAAGRFEIPSVAPGSYRFAARKAGYALQERTLTVAEGQEPSSVELLLDPTEGLTLVVLAPSGQPVNGEVAVAVLDGSGRAIAGGRPSTGENGRLRVSGVPPGTWQVLAAADGAATTALAASAPGGAQTVTLQPACTLEVEVPALASSTDGAAKLAVVGQDGRPFRSVGWGWRDPSADYPLQRGRVRLEDVPPGLWTVRVTGPDGKAYAGTATTAPGAPAKVVLR